MTNLPTYTETISTFELDLQAKLKLLNKHILTTTNQDVFDNAKKMLLDLLNNLVKSFYLTSDQQANYLSDLWWTHRQNSGY